MKLSYLSVLLCTFFPTLVHSQPGLTAAQISSSSAAIDSQRRVSPNGQTLALVGKVTAEDGSATGEDTAVVLQCGNSERGRVNADRRGDFSMPLRLIESDPGSALTQSPLGSVSTQDWNQCELYGEAAGYGSEHLHMFGAPTSGVVQSGTVVMHRFANIHDAGPSVSVVSLAAPEKAKRAFEKGQEQEKKGKLTAASDYFRKAVQAYPRFAIAWLELGRTQVKQNDFTSAQQSFQQATAEDPKFIDAYVQIASIAAENRQWKELAEATGHIVQLAPESTPNVWFLNSAANFNLGNIAQAETSATRGLRMDSKHQVPQLEYLYGMIMARRGDYNSAVFHMQTYVHLAPHATDLPDAQTKLAQLQKLASSQKQESVQNTAGR